MPWPRHKQAPGPGPRNAAKFPHCAAICTMPTLPGRPATYSACGVQHGHKHRQCTLTALRPAHTTPNRSCGQRGSWHTLPMICQEVVNAARLPKPAQAVCQQVPRLALRAGDEHDAPLVRLPAEHLHAARGALVAGENGHLVFDIAPPAEAGSRSSAMSKVHLQPKHLAIPCPVQGITLLLPSSCDPPGTKASRLNLEAAIHISGNGGTGTPAGPM